MARQQPAQNPRNGSLPAPPPAVCDAAARVRTVTNRIRAELVKHVRTLQTQSDKHFDKSCNIQHVINRPPDWSLARRQECPIRADGVVNQGGGGNGALTHTFNPTLADGLHRFGNS